MDAELNTIAVHFVLMLCIYRSVIGLSGQARFGPAGRVAICKLKKTYGPFPKKLEKVIYINFMYLFTHLFTYLFMYLFAYLFLYLFKYLFTH